MSTRKTTREYRISQWFPIIKACHDSGMSVRAWCKQNDVDEKRFYYWQNILRKTATETLPSVQPSRFVQLSEETTVSSEISSTFTPSMVIHVGNTSIELSDHVKPELLESVIKVLAHV